MLTRKQHELLMFINERMQESGIPPSFDEMKDALELKSKSGIHRLITALEERGFIRRLPNRARALEVLKMPEATSKTPSPIKSKVQLRVIEGDLGKSSANSSAHHPDYDEDMPKSMSIPVMGRIAAGVPIAAIQDHSHSISVPLDMITSGEHYALVVKGDSMIEAGINEGDTVLIRTQNTATRGDIVVALVDDEEATLKYYQPQGSSIELRAANPLYENRVLPSNRVKVQGRLVGLFRKY